MLAAAVIDIDPSAFMSRDVPCLPRQNDTESDIFIPKFQYIQPIDNKTVVSPCKPAPGLPPCVRVRRIRAPFHSLHFLLCFGFVPLQQEVMVRLPRNRTSRFTCPGTIQSNIIGITGGCEYWGCWGCWGCLALVGCSSAGAAWPLWVGADR